ncbi:hypothetical protein [Paracoccus seriniphilus]|uniref:hypothetical protein n=1 Tax=Paracoccus seriniphilus TaxID=184748 RepID=UPI003563117B
MKRAVFFTQFLSVTVFVGSHLAYLARPDNQGVQQPDASGAVQMVQLYLHPANIMLWALLLILWALLVLDTIGQWQDPSEPEGRSQDVGQLVWPGFSAALVLHALWPWLAQPAPWLAALAGLVAAALAYHATRCATDQNRPAIGFVAGWSLVIATALLASALAGSLEMAPAQASILGILIASGAGMTAQLQLGRQVAFSIAVISGFCAIAVTTMIHDPVTAIACILGITAMTAVLIRAAS